MLTSMHDKKISQVIEMLPGVSFYGIFLALIARADTENLLRLQSAFPEVVKEARIRYHAPGGALTVKEWQAFHTDEAEKIPSEALIKLFHDAQIKGSKGIS